MNKVEFTVEGVEGCFVCDSDEVRSYKTAKELAKSDKDFSLAFDVMERVFIGNDEKYIERMGGDVERIQTCSQQQSRRVAQKTHRLRLRPRVETRRSNR